MVDVLMTYSTQVDLRGLTKTAQKVGFLSSSSYFSYECRTGGGRVRALEAMHRFRPRSPVWPLGAACLLGLFFSRSPLGQSCLSAGLLAERRVSGEHHPRGREEAPLVQPCHQYGRGRVSEWKSECEPVLSFNINFDMIF